MASITSSRIDIIQSDAALGAEVRGLDLSQPLQPSDFATVRAALLEYGVLCFRDQQLSEQAQLDFTSGFGHPEIHRRAQPGDHLPGIFVVSNVVENGQPIGALGNDEIGFHSDLAYLPLPGMFSLLYAVEIPDEGGATSWASGYAAYESLDDATQRRLVGLRAVHRHVSEELNPPEPTQHPVVCTHPETGRQTLFLTPLFSREILGSDEADSTTLLESLLLHATKDQFIYTHHWREGDLVMWDNRCTMHRREAFVANARRVMKRTQIMTTMAPHA